MEKGVLCYVLSYLFVCGVPTLLYMCAKMNSKDGGYYGGGGEAFIVG